LRACKATAELTWFEILITASCPASGVVSAEMMGKPPLKLAGQRFGRLVALRPGRVTDSTRRSGSVLGWVCQCDCGQTTVVRTSNLRSGRSKSCGGCRRLA
jgi:hypothetical protein